MPKIVDHDVQRQKFADAAMRLIAHSGFEAMTMRKVAAEVGLSYGSLFHYFDSKDDLLLFAIEQSTAEQGRRVSEFSSQHKGLKALEQLVLDDSIVDDTSRDGWMVWLAFMYRASLQERFAEMHEALISGWVERFESMLEEARELGEVPASLNCGREAVALWIFSAGLGQQGLLHPRQLPPSRQKQLIGDYLDRLRA